jgi:hypothetical protein
MLFTALDSERSLCDYSFRPVGMCVSRGAQGAVLEIHLGNLAVAVLLRA